MYIFSKDRMTKIHSFFSVIGLAITIFFFAGAMIANALEKLDRAEKSDQAAVIQQNDIVVTVEGREAEILYINTVQGRFKFTAEIADTPKETQSGLMFRESMPHNHGMLFDFPRKKEVLMWMKNTPLSLDMVFLTSKGRVVSIARNTTPYSERVISSKKLASGVFEINAGTSKLIGLKAGDMLEHHSFTQKNNGVLKEKAN